MSGGKHGRLGTRRGSAGFASHVHSPARLRSEEPGGILRLDFGETDDGSISRFNKFVQRGT